MKRRIFIIYGVVIGLTAVLAILAIFRQREKERERLIAQKLPPYQFYNLDGSLHKNSGKTGVNTCIIYFDPECDHCEFETKEILSHISSFQGTAFVMVSANTQSKIIDFVQKFKLKNYAQFTVLQDKENAFSRWFQLSQIPSIFVYDKNEILKRKFLGETRFEAIVKSLK